LRHRSVDTDAWLEAGRGAAHSVLVVDACFSGLSPEGEPLVAGLQPAIPTFARHPAGATLLLAAGADQVAGPLPNEPRPAFSALVLDALRGSGDADGDGLVTASEAVDHAGARLFADVADRVQEPELAGPDLVLARASKPAPPPPPPPPPPAAPSAPAPVVVVAPPRRPLVRLPKIRIGRPRGSATAPEASGDRALVTAGVGFVAVLLAALGWRACREGPGG
jgi:hypothetical protein